MFGRFKGLLSAWFDIISRFARNHSPRAAIHPAHPECFRRKCIEGEGIFKSGFTIIEIMVVIAIIGLGLAVVIPRMSRNDNKLFDELIASLQSMVQTAYVNALTTGQIHRVFFDIEHNKIRLEKSTGKVNAQGKFDFEPLKISYVKTNISLDDRFEIRRFVIQGKDEMSHTAGVTTNEMWFFIMPEGLAQEVTITLYDSVQGKEKTLVMNPFTAQLGVT
jgi:type II secretion system protein H